MANQHAAPAPPTPEQQIAHLQHELAQRDQKIADLQNEKERHLLELAYQDAGDWSRHFSTVRMTITPFLITTALGILVFEWDKSRLYVAFAAVLWASMLILLYMFTGYTETRWLQQRRNAYWLGLAKVIDTKTAVLLSGTAKTDDQLKKSLHKPRSTWKDGPFLFAVALSLIFFAFCAYRMEWITPPQDSTRAHTNPQPTTASTTHRATQPS